MGSCIGRKNKVYAVPSESVCNYTILDVLKECLVCKILKLHNLALSCRKGIEECAVKKLKDIAVLIRGKEIFIRKKLDDLRNMVKSFDEFKEPVKIDKIIKQSILKKGNELVKELNTVLLYSDIRKLLQNDKDYSDFIGGELVKIGFDEKNVLISIEKEFQTKLNVGSTSYTRRKYSKEHKINS